MITKNSAGYFQVEGLILPGLIHGFSPMALGNMAFKYGSRDEVADNRSNFAEKVGINTKAVVQLDLVHGHSIKAVTRKDARNLNSGIHYLTATDAVMTKDKNVAIWILTADCAPFIFYDPKVKAIGLAHIGLKGSIEDLAALMAQKLIQDFGSYPKDIIVAVGPAIRKCCYCFHKTLVPKEALDKWSNYAQKKGDQIYVDFVGFNLDSLKSLGIEKIFDSGHCVKHLPQFFSARGEKDGKAQGRFATTVQMT